MFDILIIGGGHAGVEAALIARKMGRQVGLVSLDHSKTGRMSCNPAIGGMGKTHIAREVDALGGYIAEATDLAGIQFRVLNRKKGPAVQATRAQTDKDLYEKIIQKKLKEEGVILISDEIINFKKEKNEIISALSKSNEYSAKSYVLTTGTFLNGSILIGHEKNEGGRINEKKSSGLELFFNSLNLKTGRLKTGTPPRLDKQTVDFGSLEEQPGDSAKLFMSYLGEKNKHPKQTSCYITYTNKKTHEIIEKTDNREKYFSTYLKKLPKKYDYILIDCPPSLNLLTINSMEFCRNVLVPVQCEYYALEGLVTLKSTISELNDVLGLKIDIVAILRTMADWRNRLTREVSSQLEKHFKEKVLNTIIPRNVRLAEAPSYGQSIVDYDINSIGAEAFLSLSGELIRKFENGKKNIA